MRYIYNGVAPFTQKKAPSCTSFRVLRPYTHTGGGLTILESIAPSSRTLGGAYGLRGPRHRSWCAWCARWRLFAWDLTKYFAGLTLYNNIIVYVLPYIYYYDHRPAANGFRGFYVKTIYKLYGMGDLWHVLCRCRCMDGFSIFL